jgi:hypothetical protein
VNPAASLHHSGRPKLGYFLDAPPGPLPLVSLPNQFVEGIGFFNYSFICVHAPSEEKSEEEKDAFYDDLDEIYDECPKRDIKIIIGDLNAKMGLEEIFKPTLGKDSLHKIPNDNRIRLIDFASTHNMVIGSTMFNHRRNP